MSMSYAMVASRLADLQYTIEVVTGSESESEYDYFFSKKTVDRRYDLAGAVSFHLKILELLSAEQLIGNT